MSEQPEGRPAGGAARQRGQGKKILGMSRPQAIGLGLVALGGVVYLIYRARKNAQAAATTTAGTCPDGSTPDASGNCPQTSTDFSGQIGTLQDEIGQLQSELAGVGASGTVAGSTGTSTVPTGTTTGGTTGQGGGTTPAGPVYPLAQTGTVTSATTGRQAAVRTTDGGGTWTYAGVKISAAALAKEPKSQTGTVHSATTGRTGAVKTVNGGQTWTYAGVPSAR